jgi:uncharacterized protein YndB with AHSA1/START domain
MDAEEQDEACDHHGQPHGVLLGSRDRPLSRADLLPRGLPFFAGAAKEASIVVVAGLVPADHVPDNAGRTWMPGMKPHTPEIAMTHAALVESSAARDDAAPNAFRRSHAIVIAAPPEAVFDYVTNPKSWPQWLPSSHEIDCEDRPMRYGDTFHEHWSTRTGPVELDWVVVVCERPRLWIGLTQTPFMGPVLVQYDCEEVALDPEQWGSVCGSDQAQTKVGTRFIRTLRNPARPKMPSVEMIARMDDEAVLGLGNIKRIVEGDA